MEGKRPGLFPVRIARLVKDPGSTNSYERRRAAPGRHARKPCDSGVDFHHLEIPGEACRRLSDDFRKGHPDELLGGSTSRNTMSRAMAGS